MNTNLDSIFTVILNVEFIIGNFGNGFIAAVNTMDWVKRRKISPVDQILTALAVSRIALLWLVLLNRWLSVLYPGKWITERIVRIFYSTWTVASHFSVWFSTSLSMFYFLKIAKFSQTIFTYLKVRVKAVVTVMLLVSLVLLCLNIILMNVQLDTLITDYKVNTSHGLNLKNRQLYILLLFANSLFVLIPFAVSLVTFLLLIFSLWKHLRNMQQHAKGCRDNSTTAHIRALQTMIASLLLYTIFFLSLIVEVWNSMLLERKMLLLFTQTTRTAFPSLHSCVLILGNAKLRRASFSVLLWLRCRHKDREP